VTQWTVVYLLNLGASSPEATQVFRLIGAAVLGYLIFDSVPDFWSWVGAAVIVFSGLYLGHAERLRYRRRANKI